MEAPVFSKMEVMKEDRGYFKLQGSNYLFRGDLQILTKEKFWFANFTNNCLKWSVKRDWFADC